ncbi:hypothetical protein F5Y04DRAFT_81886 [Hypomontagnella monticulosa]|nr:hypothetical protein F5Y04DRAFT_81886 [Hypomontagnella monticulosa]
MKDMIEWLAGAASDKKMRKHAIQTANKYAKKVKPLVQTIQAVAGTYGTPEMTENVKNMAGEVKKLASEAMQFVPSMQVIGASFADSAKIFTYFSSIATAAGIATNVVQVYQGIQVLRLIDARLKDMATSLAAQTALIAQKDFPQYVHDMIRERVMQTSRDPIYEHWFFVYHPDNDWYPGFYHILESEPVGPEFCGYTKQIDTAFVFMLAARRRIRERERRAQEEGRPIRPTRLHLLIPAYQPILILEALQIPEEIGDFVMEGRINSNKEFVWLNLPEEQRHYVQDIGQFVPPSQGFFDILMSVIGLADIPPKLGERRILGARQGFIESGEEDRDVVEELNEKEAQQMQDRHRDTPLESQPRRQHGTRRERGRRRRSESISTR